MTGCNWLQPVFFIILRSRQLATAVQLQLVVEKQDLTRDQPHVFTRALVM